MTPEQAWKLLNDITATIALNRSQHDLVKQALAVLEAVLKERGQWVNRELERKSLEDHAE